MQEERTKTGRREMLEEATARASDLREMAAHAKTSQEVDALEALAAIRAHALPDGVTLTRHHGNDGQFVDHFIDDFIERWIA